MTCTLSKNLLKKASTYLTYRSKNNMGVGLRANLVDNFQVSSISFDYESKSTQNVLVPERLVGLFANSYDKLKKIRSTWKK